MDIDRILGNDEVVLRGPWDTTTTVKIAPLPMTWSTPPSATTSTSPATRSTPAARTSGSANG